MWSLLKIRSLTLNVHMCAMNWELAGKALDNTFRLCIMKGGVMIHRYIRTINDQLENKCHVR